MLSLPKLIPFDHRILYWKSYHFLKHSYPVHNPTLVTSCPKSFRLFSVLTLWTYYLASLNDPGFVRVNCFKMDTVEDVQGEIGNEGEAKRRIKVTREPSTLHHELNKGE